VTDATVPPFDSNAPDLQQVSRQISQQIANDYIQQFMAQMQEQAGIAVNQAAVQSVVGQQQPGL
jgi:hypothetical protein